MLALRRVRACVLAVLAAFLMASTGLASAIPAAPLDATVPSAGDSTLETLRQLEASLAQAAQMPGAAPSVQQDLDTVRAMIAALGPDAVSLSITTPPVPSVPPVTVPALPSAPPIAPPTLAPVPSVPAPAPPSAPAGPSAAPTYGPSPYSASPHVHSSAATPGDSEEGEVTSSSYLTPLPSDDDPVHQARFTLERNWALSGSTLTAASTSAPRQGITGVEWAFDDQVLSAGTLTPAVELLGIDGPEPSYVTFRPLQAGLHHLTLTVTWVEAGVTWKDRVTSPIYVEDPVITLVEEKVATWTPSLEEPIAAALQGDLNPLLASARQTVRGTAATGPKPTLMVLGDFLGPYALQPGNLVVPPSQVQPTLQALGGSAAGFDLSAGFGAMESAESMTGLGHPLTHSALPVVQSLVDTGVADVVFVSVLSKETGTLDREALRNALLFAELSGIVDSVLWALPSTVYMPAVVQQSMRPDFNFQQTPNVAMDPAAALPVALDSWHGVPTATGDESQSVLESLLEQASLLDLQATPYSQNAIDLMMANRDLVYPQYQALLEGVHNDLAFDSWLRQAVLDLAGLGIAVVVPSEECPTLGGEYMTVAGLNHVVGTVTVAAGTAAGAGADMCRGPDRRAAAHGNGIDFVADPIPRGGALATLQATAAELGLPAQSPVTVTYHPGSVGAAARVADAMGLVRRVQVTSLTPWSVHDLTGMLARQASQADGQPAWAQGAGFLDVDNLDPTLPAAFGRGTGVVFSPFNLEAGEAIGVAQVVVTGPLNVLAAKSAPSSVWSATGQTEWRLTTGEMGEKIVQDLSQGDFGQIDVQVRSTQFTQLDPSTAVVTLVLAAIPAVDPTATQGGGTAAGPLDPPRQWLLPGLYSGHTWISTPHGIIQLPINIGVGTIYDVYRFLAPDTPVPETAVCLGPPFSMIGDLTGFRKTAMELEELKICIYWANTDGNGVARFYTPLPIFYTLKSWFNGHFVERNDASGTNYPHVERTIRVPSPLNLTGIQGYAGGLPGSANPVLPNPGTGQATVDLELPYPLAYVPVNQSIAVAIAVHWRYRDNMETDHILPMPDMPLPEFINLLAGGLIPDPVLGRASNALALARQNGEGMLNSGREHLGPLVDATQEKFKDAVPVRSTTLDAMLGTPLSKAIPFSLEPDPNACSFGYGHLTSPALTPDAQAAIGAVSHAGMQTVDTIDEVRQHLDDEMQWPDTLAMRARPTLDHLLGLTTNVPLCVATYPFNIPQPNKYPTKITHEFDLHLEAALLLVCVESVADVECYLLVPGPSGTGNIIVAVNPNMLTDQATGLLQGDDPTDRIARASGFAGQASTDLVATVETLVGKVQAASLELPDNLKLSADGHVALKYTINGGGGDHGAIHYVAIPLPLLASGFLDPLVGALVQAGVDPHSLLQGVSAPATGTPADPFVTQGGQLLRDSAQDLLRVQSYAEISKASMFLDAWWWTDSFTHMPAAPSKALPRVTRAGCDFAWSSFLHPGNTKQCILTAGQPTINSGSAETPNGAFGFGDAIWWVSHPNINRALFERGIALWDPMTLQPPDEAGLVAAGYPWEQAEFFENVMEFWDDENVVDAEPQELHVHGASHTHQQVESGNLCTNVKRVGIANGAPTNNLVTGQDCFVPFNFEEGNSFLVHGDDRGTGVYDPGLGTSGVNLISLRLVDSVAGVATDAASLVWGTSIATTPYGSSVDQVSESALGLAPGTLRWWDRGGTPTANRAVYADLYTNSSYFLTKHHQTCEEMNQFTVNVIPMKTLDTHPRWKVDCPWKSGNANGPAYVPPANGNPGFWNWKRGTPDFSATVSRLCMPDDVGGAGPLYGQPLPKWVGGACMDGTYVGSSYADILQPTWYNGTYRIDWDAWNACKADPQAFPGVSCAGRHPMEQAGLDVPILTRGERLVSDGKVIVNSTLDWFGMNWRGWDATEDYVTVPLPSNPEGWFGKHPDATEWDAFYRNRVFREWDADFSQPFPQDTPYSWFQDNITARAPALRAWLDASPFWEDVHGQPVDPYVLGRLRASTDSDQPTKMPDGSPACDGWTWQGRCHMRVASIDVGDLSRFGRAGFWDREAKPKTGYFPQALLFARFNRDHLVPVTSNGALVPDPVDPRGNSWTVTSTRLGNNWFDKCWYDPAAEHGPAGRFHLETDTPYHVTFWDGPTDARIYTHIDPATGQAGPTPPVYTGHWCTDPSGNLVPKRSEREFIQQRLPVAMMGGTPTIDQLPPVTPYKAGSGDEADIVAIATGTQILPKLVRAVIDDSANIVDKHLPPIDLRADQHVETLFVAVDDTGIPALAQEILADLPVPELTVPESGAGSPVVPLMQLRVAPDVQVGELVVLQEARFAAGQQGIFVASADGGLTWSLLAGRGTPGVVDTTVAAGAATSLAFLDVSAFRGQTILVGTQLLGAGWATAEWQVQQILGLAAGATGFAPPISTSPVAGAWDLVYTAANTPADIAALEPQAGARARVLLTAPLTIAEAQQLVFTDVDIVAAPCSPGHACPIEVRGHLELDGVTLGPQTASAPVSVGVLGSLLARECDLHGLLSGLMALGGSITIDRCWLTGAGSMGAVVLYGDLQVTDSVLQGQTLGVYALASHVRLERNLFTQQVRAAGLFDESYGTVRDNIVLHTKQAGFLARSPLGGGDLAFLGNRIEETGTGIAFHLDVEDRLLPIDLHGHDVPVEARDRAQANGFEWTNLEALGLGPASAPVAYGNLASHGNVGARIGWLTPATLNGNNLYSNRNAWQDDVLRPGWGLVGSWLPGWVTAGFNAGNTPSWWQTNYPTGATWTDLWELGIPPRDGLTWNGLWQLQGLSLPSDASGNYWGPLPADTDAVWPSDYVLHNSQVDTSGALAQPAQAPYKAILTAPGYAGGLASILPPGTVLSPFTSAAIANTIVDPGAMDQLLRDEAPLATIGRPVTVTVDVEPGITAVRVEATFYGSGLPDLTGITDLAALEELLAGEFPAILPTPRVEGTDLQDVPITGTWGTFAFSFAGPRQAYVDWRVTAYTKDGVTVQVAPGDPAAKAVRIHNSVSFPLLPELVLLARDLTFDTVTSADGAMAATGHQVTALPIPLDPVAMQDLGLPSTLMQDGTIALSGGGDLLTLVHDQDPVRTYEFRYRLANEDEGVWHPLATGAGMDRTFALPTPPEGATMTLMGRATDASGLTSPWTAVQFLRDTARPTLELGEACLNGLGDRLPYTASDAQSGLRASGIGEIHLVATLLSDDGTVDLGHSYTWDDLEARGETRSSDWPFGDENPDAPAGTYTVAGHAYDRAGLAGLDTGLFVLDLQDPVLTVDDVSPLARYKAMVDQGDTWLGAGEATTELAAIGGNMALIVDASDTGASCGLHSAAVDYMVDDDGEWRRFSDLNVEGTDLPGLVLGTFPLQDHDGQRIAFRVTLTDGSGRSVQWETGSAHIDFQAPDVVFSPPLPRCSTGPSGPYQYGSNELASPYGPGTGLDHLHLDSTGVPTGSAGSAAHDGLAGQTSAGGEYVFAPTNPGVYRVTLSAADRAGNARSLEQGTLVVDTLEPTIQPSGILAQLPGRTQVTAADAAQELDLVALIDDTLGPSCGLLSGTLLVGVDGASPQAVANLPAEPGAAANLAHALDLTTLQGHSVTVRIDATDIAGHGVTWPSTPMGPVLVDTARPVFESLPTVPPVAGKAGFTVAWTASDVGTGLASQAWSLLKADGTVVATGAPGALVQVPQALDGTTLTLRATLTDGVGNTRTADAAFLFDGTAPVVSMVVAPRIAGSKVLVEWVASDAVGAIASFSVTRIERTAQGTTEVALASVAGSLRSLLEDGATISGRWVSYRVVATDQGGNPSLAATSAETYVDLAAPGLSVTGSPLLGRTTVTSADLGLPGAVTLDLGAGLGATVIGPGAQPARLDFTMRGSHPNPEVTLSASATVDGNAVTLDATGTNEWTYRHDLAQAPRDRVQVLRFKVTGANGLASETTTRLLLPDESQLVSADQRANSEWTGATWSNFRFDGNRSVYIDSYGKAAATATWSTEQPAPRIGVQAYVYLSAKTSGRFDVLRLNEGQGVRTALVMKDATRTLHVQTPAGDVSTGLALGTAAWVKVDLVLAGSSVDVYVNGRLLGTYATASPAGPVTSVSFGGAGGRAYLDMLTVRSLALKVGGIQASLPIRGVDGWTATTTSPNGKMDQPLDGAGVSQHLVPGSTTDRIRSPLFASGATSHAVINFRVPTSSGARTEVARVLTSSGSILLQAYTDRNNLYVTDGYVPGTTTAQTLMFTANTGTAWHRLDLYLDSNGYLATLDQGTQVLQGRTFLAGKAAYLEGGYGAQELFLDRIRFQSPDEGIDQTFTQGTLQRGWSETDPGTQVNVLAGSGNGHLDPGALSVAGSATSGSKAYASVDKAALGRHYLVEASVKPGSMNVIPDHQALIAGLDASNNVKWALTVGPGPTPSTWAVYLRAPDGTSTMVGAAQTTASWHGVNADVNEATGTIQVWLDDGYPAATATTKSVTPWPATTRLAVGDVHGGTATPTGSGVLHVDDVAAFPLP